LPREDIVYLADQANVPYGDRDDADLVRLLGANVAFLDAAGVDAIVMGCNTSCAVAARAGWPPSHAPLFDLIASAADAVAASGARRVGVIGTAATIRSGAYGEALRRAAPGLDVQEVAAPALVPLVERGVLDGPEARAAVAAACAAFSLPLDALVLACTHYPLLDAQFAAVLGEGVRRFDPALAQSERVVAFARERGLRGSGRTRYVTSGALEPYRAALTRIMGPLGPADVVESLEAAKL
jgi:glutamate racemase